MCVCVSGCVCVCVCACVSVCVSLCVCVYFFGIYTYVDTWPGRNSLFLLGGLFGLFVAGVTPLLGVPL